MIESNFLAEKHNLVSETKFHLKSSLLILKRQFQNTFSPTKRFHDKAQLKNTPVISFSESDLWYKDDNEQNWILTAGKVENLRVASKLLNGVEVTANEVFSFWKHLGNPNNRKGFVLGREIREGCIVPTIAGGLCQLSNAIYDAALKANFEIIERHRHTKVIKGSLAEQDRDATVKWNYIDLRFKSKHPFRIEIELTSEKLIVKLKSSEKINPFFDNNSNNLFQSSKLNDCYSCGNFECFKNPDRNSIKNEKAITTFILDDKWSEYDEFIQKLATDNDFFIVPFQANNFIKINRYAWTIKNAAKSKALTFRAFQRAFQIRLSSELKNNIFSSMLQLDKKVAKAASKYIPIESTHLVVSQNLLPFLWEEGVLGGRTFDVLMNRLPFEKLHERLDFAHSKYPVSKILNDFRASQTLINLENIALTKSRNIITPHQEIADIFNNKSIKLNWNLPKLTGKKLQTGTKILFPASALGRKGAYEIKQLAKELDLCIVFSGKASEDTNFWDGVQTEIAGNNIFDNIGLIVYPTYIEHQPRVLLKAIALGVPIITTSACGLTKLDNLTIIPIGDYDALKQSVKKYLI
jgi:hypothetical protein